MRHKYGQITLFIILGVLILVSFGFLIYFKELPDDSIKHISANTNKDIENIDYFITACLDTSLAEGIQNFGYYNLSLIVEYINTQIINCTNNFSSYPNLEIVEGIPSCEISNNANKSINVDLTYPLEINDNQKITNLKNFQSIFKLINEIHIDSRITLLDNKVFLTSSDNNVMLNIPFGTKIINPNGSSPYAIKIWMKDAINHSNPFALSYDFKPDGLKFDPYAILEFKYEDVDQDGIIDGTIIVEDNVIIRYFDSDESKWIAIDSDIDPEKNSVMAVVTHFTEFELTQNVFDWRDINGTNWMTEVQGTDGINTFCGDIAVMDTMEANYNIQVRKAPDETFDLSPYDWVFCGKKVYGNQGMSSLEFLKETGAVEKSCSGSCNSRNSCCKSSLVKDCKRYKIKDYKWTYNREAMKKWLADNGPLMVGYCFPHYSDGEMDERGVGICFSGEDKLVNGTKQSYNCRSHAGAIVGYDEKEEYWIVKNNMGPDDSYVEGVKVADGGYVKIKYGSCWIDGGPFPGKVGTDKNFRPDPTKGDGAAIALTLV